MTESFGSWMSEAGKKIIERSGKKLIPVSSAQVLENYRKELEAINRKLEAGEVVTGTKLRRVVSRRYQLIEQLIPEVQMKLAL